LWLGSGVALRLRSYTSLAPAFSPPADHKPKPKIKDIFVSNHRKKLMAYTAWPQLRPQRDETEGNYMAAAETSRMLRVRLNKQLASSVPVLTFPPPPKPSPLGFHRAHLSLRDLKTKP
jgi:hypothetical protein